MAKKRIAHKISLEMETSAGVFTKLANVKKIGDPGKSRDAVEMICMDQTVEQSFPSPTLKLGDATLQLYWDDGDANHQLIDASIDTAPVYTSELDLPQFRLVFPFATPITKTFRGWLKELGEVSYEVKNEVMRDITIHVNTIPVRS